MNEKAERINGWAAMIGVALQWVVMLQQDNLSQVYGERHVSHSSIHGRRVYICRPVDK